MVKGVDMMKFIKALILIGLIIGSSVTNAQSKIIFSRSKGGLNTGASLDLMLYDTKTKKTSLLLKGTVKRRGEYNATTSPDNSKIIFNTYRFSGWKLGTGDFKNGVISNVKRLTNRPNYEYSGVFSPDGSMIAFREYSWSTNQVDIFVSDKNGRNVKHFFTPNFNIQKLDWTKDGKSIVFACPKNKKVKVCVKPVSGAQKMKRLKGDGGNNFASSVSKKDNRIAFLSDRSGRVQLYTMNLDGSDVKNITPRLVTDDISGDTAAWPYKTSWSPNGEKIVFNAKVNGNFEIFIIRKDGKGLTQITKNKDTDITPYWMQ